MSALVLEAPPDGDHDLRGHYMAGIIVLTIIAVSIAWLRLYVRAFVSHNLWWDDWSMFVASVCAHTNDTALQSEHLLMQTLAHNGGDRCLPHQCVPPGSRSTSVLHPTRERSGHFQMAMGRRANKSVCCLSCSVIHCSILSPTRPAEATLHLDSMGHHRHAHRR